MFHHRFANATKVPRRKSENQKKLTQMTPACLMGETETGNLKGPNSFYLRGSFERGQAITSSRDLLKTACFNNPPPRTIFYYLPEALESPKSLTSTTKSSTPTHKFWNRAVTNPIFSWIRGGPQIIRMSIRRNPQHRNFWSSNGVRNLSQVDKN